MSAIAPNKALICARFAAVIFHAAISMSTVNAARTCLTDSVCVIAAPAVSPARRWARAGRRTPDPEHPAKKAGDKLQRRALEHHQVPGVTIHGSLVIATNRLKVEGTDVQVEPGG
jgi:hypothetical protein